MLARHLWIALITDPEMEAEVWKTLKTIGGLDDDSLASIQEIYFEQMKPLITDEQIAALRKRYRVRRKEQ